MVGHRDCYRDGLHRIFFNTCIAVGTPPTAVVDGAMVAGLAGRVGAAMQSTLSLNCPVGRPPQRQLRRLLSRGISVYLLRIFQIERGFAPPVLREGAHHVAGLTA